MIVTKWCLLFTVLGVVVRQMLICCDQLVTTVLLVAEYCPYSWECDDPGTWLGV